MSVNNPTLRWVGILIGFLFIAAALAACSGESSGSDAPRDEPQSQETESRNDDSVSAGDGDDTANGVRDEGQEDAAGLFVSVSAGDGHTCGVRSDGSVACWGDGYDGQATPPAGSFDSAGGVHTCGVRSAMISARPRRRRVPSTPSAPGSPTPAG